MGNYPTVLGAGDTKRRPLITGASGTVALCCRKWCLSRSLQVNQDWKAALQAVLVCGVHVRLASVSPADRKACAEA